jgi:hypothetical protein
MDKLLKSAARGYIPKSKGIQPTLCGFSQLVKLNVIDAR